MTSFVVLLVLVAASAWALAAKLFPSRPSDRLAAAALLTAVTPIALVRLLGALGGLRFAAVAFAMMLVAGVELFVAGRAARDLAVRDARACFRAVRDLGRSLAVLPALVGLAALGVAFAAAYLLPMWAWDSLGYHLPVVYDAVQTGELRWVPTNVPYVNVYPRDAELFYTFARLALGHDRLLDFAQAPFGLLAAAAIAAHAFRGGAPAPRALGYGLAYLAIPLVALQLASNYVDVAYAAALLLAVYFVTAELDVASAVMTALGLGLLLGTKPTSPPSVVLLSIVYLVRGARAARLGLAVPALAGAAALGSESYVRTFLRFGNPIFPIQMQIGPITLPGEDPAGPMFVQGLPPPYGQYGWLRRVLVSWFVEPFPPIYDMRMGGLGIAFAYLLLPLAVALLVTGRRSRATFPSALVFVCALATPAAHWSRFGLAAPAALLAFAAAGTFAWAPSRRALLDGALAGLLVIGLVRALPGFTGGEAISLVGVARLSPEQRETAIGVDRAEARWAAAKASLAPGELAAYDGSLSLPGRLFRADGQIRVEYIDDRGMSPADVLRWVDERNVRLLVAGDGHPAGNVAAARPDRFHPLFPCIDDACVVYLVQPRSEDVAVPLGSAGGAFLR